MRFGPIAPLSCVVAFAACSAYSPTAGWRDELAQRLPVMGHRNLIVVADSAYPEQSSPGIRTIHTGERQLDAVAAVLDAVAAAPHVQAKVYVDAELADVPERHAPGIEA